MIQNNTHNKLPPILTHKSSKRYSIALRLTLSLAATVAIISLLSAIMIYLNTRKDVDKKFEREADNTLNFLVCALTIPLWNLNQENVELIGNTISQNNNIAYLVIRNSVGVVLYSSTRKIDRDKNRYIKRKDTIFYNRQRVGEIELELTTQSIQKHLNELLWNFGKMTTLVLLSLLFFTGFFIRRYLKLPLNALNNHVQKYSEGNYDACKLSLPYIEFQEFENVLIQMVKTIKYQMDSLRQSEKKYRVLFESFPLGITITDHEGTILETNAMSEQLLNIFDSEHKRLSIINKEGWTIIRGDGSFMPVDEYASVRALKENRIIQNVEMGFMKKHSGDVVWLNVTAAPIPLDKYGVAIAYSDVTETHQIVKQLQQAQKMEAIGTLAGGIAHDFNNILVPILGYTEMLSEDSPEDTPFRSRLDKIHSAATRAKSLVKQILTFSRQEQGELILMKIQHILKEALSLIRSTIPTTIEIRKNIKQECGLIKADPTQIHQVIMNLATNAYHAMEENGGIMTISLKEVELDDQNALNLSIKKGLYACLTVSDTGTGIPEYVKEKIFDPFFTTKEQGKGTGIGLSVVQGIVKNAGGSIHLKSEVGKGTEFTIYFPVVISHIQEENAGSKTEIMQGGSERILIVDDEEALIELYKEVLERLGYQVTSIKISVEALEVFRANPDKFDMVITDMAMPNMSGDKLALKLLEIRHDIPILLCTGFSRTMSEEKVLSMGIKGLLMKPIEIGELDRKIRDVFNANKPMHVIGEVL
ncbi:MAG: response regulator [Desulfamplus sp.]|nr:response regulator [Desulfamplus sp.]